MIVKLTNSEIYEVAGGIDCYTDDQAYLLLNPGEYCMTSAQTCSWRNAQGYWALYCPEMQVRNNKGDITLSCQGVSMGIMHSHDSASCGPQCMVQLTCSGKTSCNVTCFAYYP